MTKLEKESPQAVLNFVIEDENRGLDQTIRRALNDSIGQCSLSRDAIAEEMSRISGKQITGTMLDNCTRESQAHRFPLEWVPAFVQATGSFAVLHIITDALGQPRPTSKDSALLEFAKNKLEAELAHQRAELNKTTILQQGGPR